MNAIFAMYRLAAVATIAVAACSICRADEPVAVAQVNLAKIDLPAIVDELAGLNVIPELQAAAAKQNAAAFQKAYSELLDRGAKRLFVHLRPTDVAAGGTTWGIETGSPQQAAAVRDWVQEQLAADKLPGDMKDMVPKALDLQGRFVVGAPSQERLKTVMQAIEAPQPEVKSTYDQMLEEDAFLFVFGNADSRRVVRELFPQLPAPFQEIDGKLLADGVSWAAITVKLPPKLQVTLRIETARDEVAQTLHRLAELGLNMARAALLMLSANPPQDLPMSPQQMITVLNVIKPQLEGNVLTLTLGDDEREIAFVQKLLGKPLGEAREAAYRNQRMNNFKEILLALHLYHEKHSAFPALANFNADGQSLLSWRVHILPYLGQQTLYEQFHLDEPWDSEHNKKLIAQMPDVFLDPSRTVHAQSGAGHTTCLAVQGAGLAFEGREGLPLSDFEDGASNTIVLLEAAADRAVPWTKPADWEVDREKPLDGLQGEGRAGFIAGFADGHVEFISSAIEPAELLKYLTRDAKDVIVR